MTSEKIIFYAMKGCGHCEKAAIELAEEINSGKIKVLSNFEAPYGVQGFPHFVNTMNKKTLTGWPGSKKDLLERLEFKEFYDDIDDFFNTPIKENFGKTPSPYKNCDNSSYDKALKKYPDTRTPEFGEEFYYNLIKDKCYTLQGAPTRNGQLLYPTNVGWTNAQARIAAEEAAAKAAAEAAAAKPAGGVNNFVSRQSPLDACCTRQARFWKDNYFSQNRSKTFDSLKAECMGRGKCEGFSENYEPESMPRYPVVQSMEPIPPSIHYYHDMGAGYSKLSNCWVKRPDFTA